MHCVRPFIVFVVKGKPSQAMWQDFTTGCKKICQAKHWQVQYKSDFLYSVVDACQRMSKTVPAVTSNHGETDCPYFTFQHGKRQSHGLWHYDTFL